MSFLEVGILNAWDIHLIPAVGYARAFVSHDEYVEFATDEANARLIDQFATAVRERSSQGPGAGSA